MRDNSLCPPQSCPGEEATALVALVGPLPGPQLLYVLAISDRPPMACALAYAPLAGLLHRESAKGGRLPELAGLVVFHVDAPYPGNLLRVFPRYLSFHGGRKRTSERTLKVRASCSLNNSYIPLSVVRSLRWEGAALDVPQRFASRRVSP